MDVPTQTKTFDQYYNEALQHYASGDYSTVYDLLTADESDYPDHAGEILYLRSCMAARMGNNTLSLDLIRQALYHLVRRDHAPPNPILADSPGRPRLRAACFCLDGAGEGCGCRVTAFPART